MCMWGLLLLLVVVRLIRVYGVSLQFLCMTISYDSLLARFFGLYKAEYHEFLKVLPNLD